MTLYRRRILLTASIILFLVISIIATLYAQGWRLGHDFNFIKTGGIYISSPNSGSQIFLDNELKKETNLLQSGIFIQNLKTKNYSIIVAKEGFWPWTKNLPVMKEKVTEARAFMLPLEIRGRVIIKGPFKFIEASPYQNILLIEEELSPAKKRLSFYLPDENIFLTQIPAATAGYLSFKDKLKGIEWKNDGVLFGSEKGVFKAVFNLSNNTVSATKSIEPVETSVLEKTSQRGLERIRMNQEKNEVLAEWLGNEDAMPYYFSQRKMLLFQGKDPIKNVDFFPLRRDLIIMAINNGIFAIEFDGRDKRNLQPIYKGKDPLFAISQNKKMLYVLDDNTLTQIDLSF